MKTKIFAFVLAIFCTFSLCGCRFGCLRPFCGNSSSKDSVSSENTGGSYSSGGREDTSTDSHFSDSGSDSSYDDSSDSGSADSSSSDSSSSDSSSDSSDSEAPDSSSDDDTGSSSDTDSSDTGSSDDTGSDDDPDRGEGLAAPYISLEGNILSWKAVEGAEDYIVVIGDRSCSIGNKTSVDLFELCGVHSIYCPDGAWVTVIARSALLGESPQSNEVYFTPVLP